jgi:predicted HNH restriction endonuclease
MDIPIRTKDKKPFYSPFLVEFDYNWKTNGHMYLRPEVAKALEITSWVSRGARRVTRRKLIIDPSDPDSFLAPEGKSKAVLVRRIERSRAARNACIKKYQAICAVCGLCFGGKYGEEFEDLIQVHHLNPLGFRKARKQTMRKTCVPFVPIATRWRIGIDTRRTLVQ